MWRSRRYRNRNALQNRWFSRSFVIKRRWAHVFAVLNRRLLWDSEKRKIWPWGGNFFPSTARVSLLCFSFPYFIIRGHLASGYLSPKQKRKQTNNGQGEWASNVVRVASALELDKPGVKFWQLGVLGWATLEILVCPFSDYYYRPINAWSQICFGIQNNWECTWVIRYIHCILHTTHARSGIIKHRHNFMAKYSK